MATYYIKEDDTAPQLQATLKEPDGSATDLTGTTVSIRIVEARGGEGIVNETATIDTPADGIVRYELADDDIPAAGRYRVEWVVEYGAGSTETYPNKGYHTLLVSRNATV